MNEYNEVQRIVAESYRTKIDAEELRREVKALLNGVMEKQKRVPEEDTKNVYFCKGLSVAYTMVMKLIDEKERGR